MHHFHVQKTQEEPNSFTKTKQLGKGQMKPTRLTLTAYDHFIDHI